MSKLVCSICKREINIPECCNKSMVIQGGLLCCCSDECHHQNIPECCGKLMNYV